MKNKVPSSYAGVRAAQLNRELGVYGDIAARTDV